MEDYKKITEDVLSLKQRLDKYQADFDNRLANCIADPINNTNALILDENIAALQKKELEEMQIAYTKLRGSLDSALERIAAAEQKIDDQEQYSRANCLILHGCKEVPSAGKYLEVEKHVCSTLNSHLNLDTPLNVSDLDIAHVIPSKKGIPIIIKFIRRFQRNEVYAKKKNLKNSGLVITESLTKRRLRLLEASRQAFGKHSVWTNKGNVFVFYNNKKYSISDFTDINKIKNKPTYATAAAAADAADSSLSN